MTKGQDTLPQARSGKWAPDRAIIVVSGLPRSGTSLMMSQLEKGGIPILTDKKRRPDPDNPRGYFEYEPVKQLASGKADWLPLARGKAVKIISALLAHLPATEYFKVIFVSRDMSEILASQQKMLCRRGHPPASEKENQTMGKMFSKHLADTRNHLLSRDNFHPLFVSYNEMIQEPEGQAGIICDFLGGRPDRAAMARVVEPGLYRNRASRMHDSPMNGTP